MTPLTPSSAPSAFGNGVLLCDGSNNGPPCQSYSYSNNDTCIELGDMSKRANSLRVASGYQAVLYGDPGCNRYLARYDKDVGDFGLINNEFSSMRIERIQPAGGIELCDGPNYGSPCKIFTEGKYTDLGDWRDRVESIRFVGDYVGRYHVVLNSELAFSGDPAHFDDDAPSLDDAHRNHVRSVEIYQRGPSDTATESPATVGEIVVSTVDSAGQPVLAACFDAFAATSGGARGAWAAYGCDAWDGETDGATHLPNLAPGSYFIAQAGVLPVGFGAAPDATVTVSAGSAATLTIVDPLLPPVSPTDVPTELPTEISTTVSAPTPTPFPGGSQATVAANAGWVDTGITVPSLPDAVGFSWRWRAWGEVRINAGGLPFGADGDLSCTAGATAAAPGLPCAALIGRFGSDGTPFYVGSFGLSGELDPLAHRGTLWLAVNDAPDELGDATGVFTVNVLFTPIVPELVLTPEPSPVDPIIIDDEPTEEAPTAEAVTSETDSTSTEPQPEETETSIATGDTGLLVLTVLSCEGAENWPRFDVLPLTGNFDAPSCTGNLDATLTLTDPDGAVMSVRGGDELQLPVGAYQVTNDAGGESTSLDLTADGARVVVTLPVESSSTEIDSGVIVPSGEGVPIDDPAAVEQPGNFSTPDDAATDPDNEDGTDETATTDSVVDDTQGASGSEAGAGSVPDGFIGTWSGHAVQQNPSFEWDMTVVIHSGSTGEVVGETHYPAFGCVGELTLLEADPTYPPYITVDEHFGPGQDSCVDSTMTLSWGEGMDGIGLSWTSNASSASGTAALHRATYDNPGSGTTGVSTTGSVTAFVYLCPSGVDAYHADLGSCPQVDREAIYLSLWSPDTGYSSTLDDANPNADGSYTWAGLPSGDYNLAPENPRFDGSSATIYIPGLTSYACAGPNCSEFPPGPENVVANIASTGYRLPLPASAPNQTIQVYVIGEPAGQVTATCGDCGISAPGTVSIEIHAAQCPAGYGGTDYYNGCHGNGEPGTVFSVSNADGTSQQVTSQIEMSPGPGIARANGLDLGVFSVWEPYAAPGEPVYVFCSPDQGTTVFVDQFTTASEGVSITLDAGTAVVCDWYSLS